MSEGATSVVYADELVIIVVVLRGTRKRDHLNFRINSSIAIIPVIYLRYIGVYLDEKISFSEHRRHIVKKPGSVNQDIVKYRRSK